MEIKFTTEDVKDFIKQVAIPKWHKERKLLRRKPIEYKLTKIKETKKSGCVYVIDFRDSMVENTFINELIFVVNETTFASDEYNFSEEWQQLLKLKQYAKTI
ncbi:MAG: hypothetical protein J6Q13_02395 [Clostridia bacterium]|nr:hypothetical protein [Clostridia bacterium]